MRITLPIRVLALLTAALLTMAVVSGCGTSGDDDTAETQPDTTDVVDTDSSEDESLTPVLPDASEDRDFGIADDPRTQDLVDAVSEHFGDRYAGASFDIPDTTDEEIEDYRPTMVIHVVDADDADLEWVQDQAGQIEAEWAELVTVAAVTRSLAELAELLETVLERLDDLGVTHPVELDLAGNRIVVDAPTLTADQVAQIRDGLDEGSVVTAAEVVAELAAQEAAETDEG